MSLEHLLAAHAVAATAACVVAGALLFASTFASVFAAIHVLRIPKLLPLGYERHIKRMFRFPELGAATFISGTLLSWAIWFVPCYSVHHSSRDWWSGVGGVWLVGGVALKGSSIIARYFR